MLSSEIHPDITYRNIKITKHSLLSPAKLAYDIINTKMHVLCTTAWIWYTLFPLQKYHLTSHHTRLTLTVQDICHHIMSLGLYESILEVQPGFTWNTNSHTTCNLNYNSCWKRSGTYYITKASIIQGLCINCMEVKWTFIVACTIAAFKLNTILLVTNTKCILKFTAITSMLKLQKPLHENITAETTWPTSWGYIQIHSLVCKFLYFDSYLTEIYYQWINYQKTSSGAGNCLMPNR